MFTVLRRRNYARLWWSALISATGNALLVTALPFYVYTLTRSTLASGLTLVSEIVPMVLFGVVGGLYADRWPRKRVMVTSDWLRAFILLPLLAVHTPADLWIVYATGFAGASVAHFAGPFGNAAIPRVVGEDELPAANAAFVVGGNIARLGGPALAGVILVRFGLRGIVIIDALTFALSAVLVARVSMDFGGGSERTGGTWRSVWREWTGGVRLIVARRLLALTFVTNFVGLVGAGIVGVTLVPFVQHVLRASAPEYGWVRTSMAFGGLAGGFAIERLSRRASPEMLLGWGNAVLGVLVIGMTVAASLPVTIVVVALMGPPSIALYVGSQSVLQGRVADEFRGRVFGAFLTTIGLGVLAGSVIASTMTGLSGIRPMQAIGGVLALAASLLALALLPSALAAEPATAEAVYTP